MYSNVNGSGSNIGHDGAGDVWLRQQQGRSARGYRGAGGDDCGHVGA